jgi:hypothetical protein
MGKLMGVIVFNSWHQVVIKYNDQQKNTVSEKAFLSEFSKNIGLDKYNIVYNEKNQSFTIGYNNTMFNVALPTDVKANMKMGNDNYLVKKLKALAEKKKTINEKKHKTKEFNDRVREIELSGYSKLETLDDYELYLKYLNKKAKQAKTNEEKELIAAKIKGLLKVVTNPYNLQLIYNVAEKSRFLSEERKAELEIILRSITEDYYNEIVANQDQLFVLGSSNKPMDIIRRIVDTEFLVQEWINENKKEEKAPVKEKQEEIVEENDFDLDEISNGLHQLMGRGKR